MDRREGGLLVMDLGDGRAHPGGATRRRRGRRDRATITVRPEWIKLASGRRGDRAPRTSGGTVVDVVYLGSVTQLIVLLRTGERLTVHRLNDEVGAVEPTARASR